MKKRQIIVCVPSVEARGIGDLATESHRAGAEHVRDEMNLATGMALIFRLIGNLMAGEIRGAAVVLGVVGACIAIANCQIQPMSWLSEGFDLGTRDSGDTRILGY